jgi:hypothetical protein
MNRTMTIAASAAAFAGLVLGACGSDSDDAATTTTRAPAATAAPTTEPEPTTKPTTTATDDAPTTAEFCTAADKAFGGFEPGIDAIFEDHPEPTLADWAAFLPGPTKEFDAVIARLEKVEPSAEAADELAAAIDAMQAVADNFHDSIDAAEAGDQVAFDAAERANQGSGEGEDAQGGDLDAMGAAIDAAITVCGGPS